jgi:hypothetical protein
MAEFNETTPRETYTIAGKTFTIVQPFAEGHPLTGGQASALNQVFAENMRNNFAGKVKEAVDAGTFDADVFQGQLDDYMADYEFGVRTGGGGRTSDPVQAEAMNIARDAVRRAIVAKGHKLADVKASTISELAKGVLARGDATANDILATARARVEATKAIDIDLGGADLSPAEPEAAAEAAPAKKTKASAEASA